MLLHTSLFWIAHPHISQKKDHHVRETVFSSSTSFLPQKKKNKKKEWKPQSLTYALKIVSNFPRSLAKNLKTKTGVYQEKNTYIIMKNERKIDAMMRPYQRLKVFNDFRRVLVPFRVKLKK